MSIGQYLFIPVTTNSENSSDTYTVKSGDTLYSIAQKYNLTVDELKALNNLTTNTLSIGQILKLSSKSSTNAITYIVKKGDTLYGIAKSYNISVDNLKSANNLTTNTLSIGQTLIIPTSTTSSAVTYTVKSGDTLYGIAQKFNTTVSNIKNLNNLTSDLLSIGQELIISK